MLVSSHPWVLAPKHLCMWTGGMYEMIEMHTGSHDLIIRSASSD